jgi:Putative beta barrel porin-7 (BBP7)
MRKGFLASGLGLLVSASLALAQNAQSESPGLFGPGANLCAGEANACAAPGCETCGPAGRFWASADYLLWWIKDGHVPPLVTGGPAASSGVLGTPGTVVLFGGGLDQNPFSGGRFAFGFWPDDCHKVGFETDFFFLGSQSTNFAAGGSGAAGGTTVVARPIVNATTGGEVSELVSLPGTLSGVVAVSAPSRMWGAEGNALCNLYCCGDCDSGTRIDLIAGFRYLELDESVSITETLLISPTVPVIGGSTIGVFDGFSTHNYFYGGQVGARAEWWRNRTFVNVTGKVALGDTHETVDINGNTVITPPGGKPSILPGGILALPTNIGHYEHDAFAVVPEIGFNIGYQVTDHMRAYVGYTFLYWSDVVRPGDQIDRTVNLTQIPSSAGPGTLVGPARPAFNFNQSDFWAQGINFGVEFRY